MKYFLIVVLISAIMLIACSVSNGYKDRYDFYKNLKEFLEQFKINLSFRQDKIKEFLSKTKPRKNFKLFIADFEEYLQTNKLDFSNLTILEKEEQAELGEIVLNLGKFDSETELKQLENFLAMINQKLELETENKNKLCPMIIKLSLLFAVALSILLI